MSKPVHFDQQMVPHLHALAASLLERKMYRRLSMVASLLVGLSSGGWQRLGDEEQTDFVKRMANDFHAKAWDDWDYTDPAFSAINDLVHQQQRALRTTA